MADDQSESTAGGARPGKNPGLHPTFLEALRVWVKIGLLSFGGPAGQIALMHRELVELRRWVSDSRFLHALNYCMLLPGPEAQQLAIYVGWLLHGSLGGIVAGIVFVIPGALLIGVVSYVYVVFSHVTWLEAVFYGLKPAVLAIVAGAVFRIGKKALKNKVMWGISLAAFVAIFFLNVPFPLIILGAGLTGLAGGRFKPRYFQVAGPGHPAAPEGEESVIGEGGVIGRKPSLGGTLLTLALCLAAWLLPVGLVAAWLGTEHTLFHQGLFFTKAAVVTFGGAYAVLPYVAQQAVENYGWLTATQMMDGLGLAETTPGPLILVLQFVGFLGAWGQPGGLDPLMAAVIGSILTSWVTFTSGFVFIFTGAPYIERLRGNVLLNTALSAITAAVVGVILNLAVWFGLNVLFPGERVLDGFALAIFAAALVALLQFKVDVIHVILAAAGIGLASHWLLGGA
jgi:chromate transporter